EPHRAPRGRRRPRRPRPRRGARLHPRPARAHGSERPRLLGALRPARASRRRPGRRRRLPLEGDADPRRAPRQPPHGPHPLPPPPASRPAPPAPDPLGGPPRPVPRAQHELLEPRGLSLSPLTVREQEVLRLVADGHPTREVAKRLSYSERTVKNVIHDVVTKF